MKEPPAFFKNMLKLLDAGNYPAKVSRMLSATYEARISRQKVSYWTKKAVRGGLLRLSTRDVITLYQLTPKGRELCQENLTGGDRIVRLHSFSVKYPIVEEPRVPVDWKKVEMQNWDRFIGSELGLTVEKTSKSIIIHADAVRGRDPWQLTIIAYRECEKAARHLESKFQMRLEPGELMRKPHFSVRDPLAEKLGEFMEVSDDIGKLDQSEGQGELDLYDPNFVKNYLLSFTMIPRMASNLLGIKAVLADLSKGLAEFPKNMERIVISFEKSMDKHMEAIEIFRQESKKRAQQSEEAIKALLQTTVFLFEAATDLKFMVNQIDRKITLKGQKRFPWEI